MTLEVSVAANAIKMRASLNRGGFVRHFMVKYLAQQKNKTNDKWYFLPQKKKLILSCIMPFRR